MSTLVDTRSIQLRIYKKWHLFKVVFFPLLYEIKMRVCPLKKKTEVVAVTIASIDTNYHVKASSLIKVYWTIHVLNLHIINTTEGYSFRTPSLCPVRRIIHSIGFTRKPYLKCKYLSYQNHTFTYKNRCFFFIFHFNMFYPDCTFIDCKYMVFFILFIEFSFDFEGCQISSQLSGSKY